MKESILNKISAQLELLSPSEIKVGQYILEQPHDVVNLSIAKLASRARVSEPTVIRFCKSLKCKGYQKLKLLLAADLAGGAPQQQLSTKNNPLIDNVCSNNCLALQYIQENINEEDVEKAVQSIRLATKVEIYSSMATKVVAIDAEYRLLQAGIHANYRDTYLQRLSATTSTTNTVCLVLSNTGESSSIIETSYMVKEHGAKIIGITPPESTLARRCEIVLPPPPPTDTSSTALMTLRLCQTTLIDILCHSILYKQKHEIAQ